MRSTQPIYIPLNDLFGLDMKLRSTQPIIMKVHDLFVLDMKLKLGGKIYPTFLDCHLIMIFLLEL